MLCPASTSISEAPREASADLAAQYVRNTTTRPLLSFAAMGILPIVSELLCRLLAAA